MSKLSIYDNGWINLVFEGKNKDYGAYQLRQQSDRTTVIAFFGGLLFISSVACVYLIANLLGISRLQIAIPQNLDEIIQVSNYTPNNPPKTKTVVPITKKAAKPNENEILKNPVVAAPHDVTQNIATTKEPAATTTTSGTEGTGTATTITTSSGSGTETTPDPSGNTIFSNPAALDKMPFFPGGIEKFYQYVGRNFSTPDADENKTMRIYVSFVIEKDGSMTDIQVKRDPGFGLGKEAIRVLKSLKTKWEPGLVNGRPVRTAYNLPITVEVK